MPWYSSSFYWIFKSISWSLVCVLLLSSATRLLSFFSLYNFWSKRTLSFSKMVNLISYPSLYYLTISFPSFSIFNLISILLFLMKSMSYWAYLILLIKSCSSYCSTILLNFYYNFCISNCMVEMFFLLLSIWRSVTRASSSLGTLLIICLGRIRSIIWSVSLFIFFNISFSLDCSFVR
jgi:hypothetical protein